MIIPELLSKIYTDTIYVVDELSQAKTTNEVPAANTKEKVIVKNPDLPQKAIKTFDHVVLSDIEPNPDQKELLNKILQAVGLNIEKVKFICGIDYPDDISSKNLISFNVSLPGVSLAEKYKIVEKGSGKILLSDSLAVLETDVPRKKALWQALQKMYSK